MAKRSRNVIVWDIESTHLSANFGYILCIGWKRLDASRIYIPALRDFNGVCKTCHQVNNPIDDKKLLEHIYPILSQADAWITWFGKGFDQKFVNTRLMHHGMDPLPPVPHIDGWRTAKSKLRLTSNRLATVQQFLNLPVSKTPVTGRHWNLASGGDPKAADYIIEHCRKDVKVLEQAYEKMLPLIVDSPHMGLIKGKPDGCPRCGLPALKTNPSWIYSSATRSYQRYKCTACGGWCKENKAIGRSAIMAI